jgi:hypothetical protein
MTSGDNNENGIFQQLEDTLDVDYEREVFKAESDLQEIEEKKQELMSIVDNTNSREITLQDYGFMNKELKSLVENTKKVLEVLYGQLKVGAPSRAFEVYSTLTNSVTAQLKELRELNKTVLMLNPMMNQSEPTDDGNIKMSAKQLADLISKAKDNSELNKIDADFDLIQEEDTKEESGDDK